MIKCYATTLGNFPKSIKKNWKLLLHENIYDKTHKTSYTKQKMGRIYFSMSLQQQSYKTKVFIHNLITTP
jgi:hypothetical protein